MIKTEKLAKGINKLLDIEKTLVPLFDKHISSALTFSGIAEESRRKVTEHFQRMALTHQRHIETLEEIKERVAKDGVDVY